MLFEIITFPEFRHLNNERCHVIFDVNSTRLLLVDSLLLSVLLTVNSLDDRGLAELRSVHGSNKETEIAIRTMLELVQVHHVLCPTTASQTTPMAGNWDCNRKIDHILLNVSTACQLRCKYCFAEGGHYGRPDSETIMPWDVARAAIDMLDFRDAEGHNIAVGFFGGEPLINWEIIEKSIHYAKSIAHGYANTRIVFNMTTNGVGLTLERAKFLKEHDCSIMFSIDGCEATHNELRPAKDAEQNSWQSTVQGYNNWLSVGGRALTARATITAKDMDVSSMIDLFRRLGFGAINTQLVQTEDPELKLSIAQLHHYEAHQLSLLTEDISKSTDLQRVFSSLCEGRPRPGFCGVGRSGYAVQPNGDIFLCHRFASDDNFKIGHVFSGVDASELAKHQGWRVNKSLVCSRCWARHICGGGCYAENYFATQDTLSPRPERCYLTKSMLYHAIEFLVQHSEKMPNIPLVSTREC